jgi:hypothetical protein
MDSVKDVLTKSIHTETWEGRRFLQNAAGNGIHRCRPHSI